MTTKHRYSAPRMASTTAGALAAFLVLAACGAGSSGTTASPADPATSDNTTATPSSGPDVGAAQAALATWLKAYEAGDGRSACSLMTAGYTQETLTVGAKQGFWKAGTSCQDAVVAGAALIRAFGGSGAYTISKASATATTVTFTVAYQKKSSGTDHYDLTLTDGKWLVSADDESKGSTAAKTSEAESAAQTSRWVSNWCLLATGQTRFQARALMGTPTSVFTTQDNATPQYNWSQGPYSFTAFFDTDWRVNRFYANYDDLGESDLAKMPCSKTRPQT